MSNENYFTWYNPDECRMNIPEYAVTGNIFTGKIRTSTLAIMSTKEDWKIEFYSEPELSFEVKGNMPTKEEFMVCIITLPISILAAECLWIAVVDKFNQLKTQEE